VLTVQIFREIAETVLSYEIEAIQVQGLGSYFYFTLPLFEEPT